MGKYLFSFFALLIVIPIVFSGCHKKHPSDILSPAEMEKLLYEYHISCSLSKDGDSAIYKSHLNYQHFLKNNHLTDEDFNKNILWYSQHAELFKEIYERLNERLEKEALTLGIATSDTKKYSQLTSIGDTANIWNGLHFYLLTSEGVNNRFSFKIKADSTFLPEDIFLLHFTSKFVAHDDNKNAIVNLTLTYENDSIQTVINHMYSDGEYSLQLIQANVPLKEVSGFVYLNTGYSIKSKLLFISNPSLIRFHNQTRKISEPETESKEHPKNTSVDSIPLDSNKSMLFKSPETHTKPIPLRKQKMQQNNQLK